MSCTGVNAKPGPCLSPDSLNLTVSCQETGEAEWKELQEKENAEREKLAAELVFPAQNSAAGKDVGVYKWENNAKMIFFSNDFHRIVQTSFSQLWCTCSELYKDDDIFWF